MLKDVRRSRAAGLMAAVFVLALGAALVPAQAQSSREAAALSLRLNQTEDRLRRMTGRVEELSHRLQQMEDRLRRALEDTEFRFQELGKGKSKSRVRNTRRAPRAKAQPSRAERRAVAPGAIAGNRDDGGLDPARAGTVRSLGVIPGRALNFDVNPNKTGLLPRGRPAPVDARESYDQAYGMILRRDYSGAEEAFHRFLNTYGNDPLAGNAQYWLGESYYARGLYRDAADAFLAGYTKYKRSSKAPGSLFKLGMTLLKLKQKQAACASFAEMNRKFPRAPKALKKRAARERSRAGC